MINCFQLCARPAQSLTLFPYTTLFRSPGVGEKIRQSKKFEPDTETALKNAIAEFKTQFKAKMADQDRKSTRLNSSHMSISYAVFCLKKKMLKSEPGQRDFRLVGEM